MLELGSGCGLAGIVCARYARHVTLTDYVEQTVDNIAYNVRLNSGVYGDASAEGGWWGAIDGVPLRQDIVPVTAVGYLDWDAVAVQPDEPAAAAAATTTTTAAVAAAAPSAPPIDGAQCSAVLHGRSYAQQRNYRCRQCFGDDASATICTACARICHADHAGVVAQAECRCRCDCYYAEHASCAWRTRRSSVSLAPVDMVIGAELTYSLLSVDALARTVDHYLKPDGVFYEVLSEDRDGVADFCARMQQRGFRIDRRVARRGAARR